MLLRKLSITFLVFLVLAMAAPARPAGKIQQVLAELEQVTETLGLDEARVFAEQRVRNTIGDRVWVQVDQAPGTTTDDVDIDAILDVGGEVLGMSEHFLEVSIPFDQLTELTECGGVAYVRMLPWPTPPSPILASGSRRVTSEGVGEIHADQWHAHGYTGEGIKVAIIDVGFEKYKRQLSEFPAGVDSAVVGFPPGTPLGGPGTDEHGTAVAEIVADMAPDAPLLLIRVRGQFSSDFEQAVALAKFRSAKIINHSRGFEIHVPGDGSGPFCAIVNRAHTDHGMFWVNAAGNEAQRHNGGGFTDTNGDLKHEFITGGDQTLTLDLLAGETVGLYLKWANWGSTVAEWDDNEIDYDLYLLDAANATVASATTRTNHATPGFPEEEIVYAVPAAGVYHVEIRKDPASDPADAPYDLYAWSFNHPQSDSRSGVMFAPPIGEHAVARRSLSSPGDALYSHTTAAADVNDWPDPYPPGPPIQPYSSQGPTHGDSPRLGVSITGPDNVSSAAYGSRWGGTSAAAPHVAGAAAVVWSRWPDFSNAGVWVYLYENRRPAGASALDGDTIFGHGLVNLPPFPTAVEDMCYADLTESGSVLLRWTVGSLGDITGFDVYRATSRDGAFVRISAEVIDPLSPGQFEDTAVWPDSEFWYEVRARLCDGTEDVIQGSPVSVRTSGTLALRLAHPNPNPFRESTAVEFDLPGHIGQVRLAVYSPAGRLVRTLVDGAVERGRHAVTWDGRDGFGRRISAGVYFLRLEAEGHQAMKKVVVLG